MDRSLQINIWKPKAQNVQLQADLQAHRVLQTAVSRSDWCPVVVIPTWWYTFSWSPLNSTHSLTAPYCPCAPRAQHRSSSCSSVRSSEYRGWRKQQSRVQHSPRAWPGHLLQLCKGHSPEKGEGLGDIQGLPARSLMHLLLQQSDREQHVTGTPALCWHITKRYKFNSYESQTHNSGSPEPTRTHISEFMLSGVTPDVAWNFQGQSYLTSIWAYWNITDVPQWITVLLNNSPRKNNKNGMSGTILQSQ